MLSMTNSMVSGLTSYGLSGNSNQITPLDAFRQGEKGLAFAPFSDFTKLFQDSAGTTPVTAFEQAVGLAADISQGKLVWTNNPAPEGFRVPTQAEWAALVTAEGITNSATAFSSRLKLTAVGFRNTSGTRTNQGIYGFYWSSTNSSSLAYNLYYSDSVYPANSSSRAYGCAVRPIWTGAGTPPATVTGRGSDTNTYGVVLGADGKYWLDRNLGASQVATSSTDTSAYGWLYQWGRGTDGHQITTSSTTATLSTGNVAGHGLFITTSVTPNDWRSGQNNQLWNINGAYQSINPNRPIVSARYNGLIATEDFSNSNWRKVGTCTVTNTNVINLPSAGSFIYQSFTTNSPVGSKYIFSVYLSGSGTLTLVINQQAGGGVAEESTTNVVLTAVPTRYFVEHTIVNVGQIGVSASISNRNGNTATQVTATKADLRYSNDGVGLPSYQRVTTSTDYDTVGFPAYLKFNGVNQCLQTNTINFTDKMTVWAGVRKMSDAARGIFAELSPSVGSNDGAFVLSQYSNPKKYNFSSRGTVVIEGVSPSEYTAPITNTLTGIGYISGDICRFRINGAQVAEALTDQGTGNYGNYPLYIGARAGTSLFFNGRLYALTVRGAESDTRLLNGIERYNNNLTKAY